MPTDSTRSGVAAGGRPCVHRVFLDAGCAVVTMLKPSLEPCEERIVAGKDILDLGNGDVVGAVLS
jgi:hypothetical protein